MRGGERERGSESESEVEEQDADGERKMEEGKKAGVKEFSSTMIQRNGMPTTPDAQYRYATKASWVFRTCLPKSIVAYFVYPGIRQSVLFSNSNV